MRMRTNDIDSNSFCVNIMIERKQVPEIDFVIASLRQKTFESYLNLSFYARLKLNFYPNIFSFCGNYNFLF